MVSPQLASIKGLKSGSKWLSSLQDGIRTPGYWPLIKSIFFWYPSGLTAPLAIVNSYERVTPVSAAPVYGSEVEALFEPHGKPLIIGLFRRYKLSCT